METDKKSMADMMKVEPQAEHQWLQKLAGEWTVEGEANMGPNQPPMTFKGTESARSIGGLWVVAEGKGDMPGCGPSTMIMTLGYDPGKKRFVGTFLGSMMTHLWLYDGELDSAKRVLTLDSVGPDMSADGKMTNFKDAIEFKSDDHRVLTSRMQRSDGTWHEIMRADYRRK